MRTEIQNAANRVSLKLSIFMDTTKFWYLFLYIHDKEQDILVL